jgi:hypothetical protein
MTEAPPSSAPPSLNPATAEADAATRRRPEPLLVQGEAESTRIDIAARVSGRLAKIAVSRG